VDSKPQNARGVADLSLAQSVTIMDSRKFQITTPKRIWCFECRNTKERDAWIKAIAKLTKANIIPQPTN